MKVTLRQLKRLIRETIMNESTCPCGIDRRDCDYHKNITMKTNEPKKRTFTEDRHMTSDEALELCKEMGLDQATTDYIVYQFVKTEEGEYTPDVGSNGRLAWGQSWDSIAEELADAMGADPDGDYGSVEMGHEPNEVNKVYDVFFEE